MLRDGAKNAPPHDERNLGNSKLITAQLNQGFHYLRKINIILIFKLRAINKP
jgi:hypothetical protein